MTHTHTYTLRPTGPCPHCRGARSEIHIVKGESEAPRYQRCNLCCECRGGEPAIEPRQLALMEGV